ncbi:MAG: GntR family transcriptional regulator [Phycisphaeraceae bacterium]|nr:GntR family transcriptional regulator [Phycisphaeraceae bacterium]
MRYARIRDEIEQQITSGMLKPGDKLPTEIELSKKYKTARGTVAKALGELETRGLLSRRRGAGTFIRVPISKSNFVTRLAMFTPWALRGEPIGYFQSRLYAAMSSICAEHGAELLLQGLSHTGSDYRSKLFNAADQLIQREIAVVYFCPAELSREEMGINEELVDHLESAGCAVILIDRDIATYPDRSTSPWICYDNRRGATQLANHMFEQGYERIAFVGIPTDSTAVMHRQAGYIDALIESGREVDRSLLLTTTHPDVQFVRRIIHDIKADAIMAKDTHIAAIIGAVMLQEGIEIGKQIGLAGFEADPASSILHIPLTLVRQPIMPFVNATYETTLRVINKTCVLGEQIVIPTELEVQQSTLR